MNLLNNIKNWYKNFNKTQCPKCKSSNLKQLEENYLYTTKLNNTTKYNAPSERLIKEKYSYITYDIYEIKNCCQSCQNVFSKRATK